MNLQWYRGHVLTCEHVPIKLFSVKLIQIYIFSLDTTWVMTH
jgi:hypothetical protein